MFTLSKHNKTLLFRFHTHTRARTHTHTHTHTHTYIYINGNYTRMLRAILKKSKSQHPTKQWLNDNLPPITKTIQVRRTRHAVHCQRRGEELINDMLLWTSSPGRTKAGQPAGTFKQQFCADTGCSLEDLPGAMDDRDGLREKVREIRAGCATGWWWWWYILTFLYFFIQREKIRAIPCPHQPPTSDNTTVSVAKVVLQVPPASSVPGQGMKTNRKKVLLHSLR